MGQDSKIEGDSGGEPVKVRTIADLAKLAGVNPATVSRALADKSIVNAKTREKIQALARQHGFRPNQMASKLRTQRTGVIGVAIPLGHDHRQQISDTFFMTLLGHLADELTEKNYDLMLSRVIPDREEDWLERITGSGMVDGLIVIGQSDQYERIEAVARDYMPLVVWGNHEAGQRHCVVGSDNRRGGQLATEHLIECGAHNLAFLGDISALEFAARLDGMNDVANARGVPVRELPTHLSPDRMGKEITAHLDKHGAEIDGIFAATDTIALACLRALHHRKLAVPRAIRLVGFDDLPLAQQAMPPLTTIQQNIAAGARALVDLLLRRLAGEDTESLVMPPQLVARETT